MATIFETDFDTGTVGNNLTATSSGFDQLIGTGAPVYVAGLRGSAAMRVATSSAAQKSMGKIFSSGSSIWVRFYAKMASAIQFYGLQVQTEATVNAVMRINSNGSIRLRSSSANLGAADVGAGALNNSTSTRVEWQITPTIQRARLFTGANLHGTTPDFDTGDLSWSGIAFDRMQIGVVSGTNGVDITYDDFKIDNATWVGPVVSDTANAGSDRSVAAWEDVSHNGTGSAVGTWSQISGPSVGSLPAGATLTFNARPSDTPGQTAVRVFRYTVGTATDDVQITTASATHFFGSSASPKAVRIYYP